MDILDTLPKADEDAQAILEEVRAASTEELPLPAEAYERFGAAD